MVSNRKVLMAFVSVLLALSLLLSACSSNNNSKDEPKKSEPSSTSSTDVVEKRQPVTLEMSWWGGDTRHTALQAAVKLFEQKYDWIKVKTTFGGWEGYHDKLTVQLSTNKAPDLFMYSTNFLTNFSDGNKLLNLSEKSDELPFVPELTEKFPQILVGDKLFGAPSGLSQGVLVYDKKLFDEAGVEYPTDNETWISLGEKWEKVHQAIPNVYGDVGWFYSTQSFREIIQQITGVDPIDRKANPPTINFHTAETMKVWEWTEKMWAEGVVPRDVVQQVGFDSQNMATGGSASSGFLGIVAKTTNPLGLAVSPRTFDGTGKKQQAVPGPAGLWGVAAASKHPAEALMLINFLMTDSDGLKATNLETGAPAVTASLEILRDAVVPESKEQQMLDAILRSQEGVEVWIGQDPPLKGMAEAEDAFQTILEEYIFKKITKEEFLSKAEKAMNEKLAEANK